MGDILTHVSPRISQQTEKVEQPFYNYWPLASNRNVIGSSK